MIKVDLGKQRACLSPCTRTKPDCHAFARKDEQNTERFSSLATKKRVGTQKNISHPYGKIRADFIMLRQVYGKTQVTSKVYPSSPLHGSSPRPSGLARKQSPKGRAKVQRLGEAERLAWLLPTKLTGGNAKKLIPPLRKDLGRLCAAQATPTKKELERFSSLLK